MNFILKLLLTNLVILTSVWLGRRHPSLSGLIATMPLTSLTVLLWLYHDDPSASGSLTSYVGGVFFGVLPTLCFFGAALICLRRGASLPSTLVLAFAVWFAAAAVHQALLR